MTIDEETLMAFADGELAGAERDAVERALAEDPLLRAMLEQQRRLRERLTGHYGPVAEEEVPERLLAMLGAERPEGVVSLGAARAKRRAAPRVWHGYGAIAASLAVGLLAGQLLSLSGGGPIAARDGVILAQGSLASALETQLASNPDGNSPVRIGITFADRQGRVCRTFDASALSGLACRGGADWQILIASSSNPQDTQFRQASSPAVVQAAEQIMAAPPLDAEGERKAMQAGWKISAAAD